MAASLPQLHASRSQPSTDGWLFPWCAAGALLLVSLLLGTGLLLLIRRTAGALSEPLSGGMLLGVGVCLALAGIAARSLWHAAKQGSSPVWLRWLMQWGPTLAVAMFGVALSVEGTSLWAVTLYLLLIVSADFLAEYQLHLRPGKISISRESLPLDRPASPAPSAGSSERSTPVPQQFLPPQELETRESEAEPLTEAAWQQTTRIHTESGELITGWVRAEFGPGERTANLHLAFCPPLDRLPEFHFEQISGPAARIKAGQVLLQGARLEIRLNVPAVGQESLLIEFVAEEHGAGDEGEAND